MDVSVGEGSKKNVNDDRVVYIGHDQISTTGEQSSVNMRHGQEDTGENILRFF